MTIDRRPDPSLGPFLAASLLLHLLVLSALLVSGVMPLVNTSLPLVVELVAPPPPPPLPKGGQVVEAPPSPMPQENPDARLLAKQSSRVKEETIRPGTPGAPAPAPAKAKPESVEPEKEALLRKETARLQAELAALRKRRAALERQSRRLEEAEHRQAEEAERLRAEAAERNRRGNGGTNDFVEEARMGRATRLNTRAFEESQYYINFKTSFGVLFRASDVSMRLRFSEDSSDHPRTILAIVVNADGTLRDLRVLRSSGFSALDRDALEAAGRVFPFDPPPTKLLDGSDSLRFAFGILW
jgi:TonB family protein